MMFLKYSCFQLMLFLLHCALVVLDSLMFYKIPNSASTPVNGLSFTSGFGSEADWIVLENDGL
jgi:hypothetical protein